MRFAPITERLADLGAAKWAVHERARAMQAAGESVIMLSIGEPDVPTPPELIEAAAAAMRAGRTGYSNGRGEGRLLDALAARYSARRGRPFGRENFVAFPGTQTALFAVLSALAGPGDEVLTGDPMYATYEGVIRATGATLAPVPLRPEAGFRMQAADLAPRIGPRSRVILLNSPHNPTGAVLGADEIARIGSLAQAHDLWIVADEVYEDLVFDAGRFVSPLAFPDLAERVVACASISKSHAAAGFRSGWCAGPAEFCARLLPLAETMLFGNQPFIADMTAAALAAPDLVAGPMRARLAARAARLSAALDGAEGLRTNRPEAGMFVLLDVSETGLDGAGFAEALLSVEHVAVMPGSSFGAALGSWVRIGLTAADADLDEAARRIRRFAARARAD